MRTRSLGGVLLIAILLSGCTKPTREFPSFLRMELSEKWLREDPDLVATSLRAEPETIVAKLPRFVDQPDLSLRLRSTYARLQLQWPLLQERLPMRLTMIARSYSESDAIGSLRGKFLLKLSFPLSSRQHHSKGATSVPSIGGASVENLGRSSEDEMTNAGAGMIDDSDMIDAWLTDLHLPIPIDDRS